MRKTGSNSRSASVRPLWAIGWTARFARRSEGEPEFVAYGVVVGKAQRRARHPIPWGGSFRSLRRLKPFRTKRPPEFNMQTKKKIIRAQRRESVLLQNYKEWLWRRGRHLEGRQVL